MAQWNPYGAAGSALGAMPDYALYSPLTVPFYVLPSWLAPAYERLLEIVCSVGGAFLFLRRLSLSRPAALLGGITFAGSGFMVAWLGFPQTRVAAFIPALFWAVERFVQERRARDAALVALPVAALLLGGFPLGRRVRAADGGRLRAGPAGLSSTVRTCGGWCGRCCVWVPAWPPASVWCCSSWCRSSSSSGPG